MADRHAPLRTVVETVEGAPFGRLTPPPPPGEALIVEDLTRLSSEERHCELFVRLASEAARPFDLGADPPLRSRLFRLGDDDHVLMLVMHHAAVDDISLATFARELAAAYRARQSDRPPHLPSLPVEYFDHAAWQQTRLETGGFAHQIAYWRDRMRGAPGVLALPADRPRRADRDRRTGVLALHFETKLVERLETLARGCGATLFTVLLAGYASTLARLAGQDDIVIGTPVASRGCVEVEELIGFFANTLPIRLDLSGEPDVRALVDRARAAVVGALVNQDVPFDRLVEELAPARSRSHTPLFQAAFTWESQNLSSLALPGVSAEALFITPPRAKFDLTLGLSSPSPRRLEGWIEYDGSLFDRETVERWSRYFVRVLESMSASMDPVLRAPIMDEEERRQVLERFNETGEPTPEATIAALFEAQVASIPDAIALVAGEAQIAYAELDASANRLARHLIAQGVGPESIVGLALERSAAMIVALIAIAKAGAGYLPLNPGDPAPRLQFTIEDANPALIVTTTEAGKSLPGCTSLIRVDDPSTVAELASRPSRAPCDAERSAPLVPSSLAYVIYTSGSTGAPKGVVTTQANVTSLAWRPSYAALGPQNVVLQFAPITFDAATFEIWGALLNGARLVLAPSGAPDIDALAEVIASHRVDTAWLTSSFFSHVVETRSEMLAPLRQLLAGGEALPPSAVARIAAKYPDLVVINGYGPTETTTFACTREITRSDAESERIPIGTPIRGARVYVLDDHREPVPIGVAGELYVAGAGVARGYLNRPELTAERFVACPFGSPGSSMYRTGDLVRWRNDSALDFLGRLDRQVKVRGFRVEPAEIEAVLASIDGIGQAVVAPRQSDAGIRLVAYVVPARGKTLRNSAALRAALAERLPHYMVPSAFASLAALPLTANGKLDLDALPEPDAVREDEGAPESPAERLLCELMGRALKVKEVLATDNFFDLGGHSLTGLRLMHAIEAATGTRLHLAALFAAPTAKELALRISSKQEGPSTSSLFYLHRKTAGAPIFVVHWMPRDLARELGSKRPVYGLSLDPTLMPADAQFPTSIEELAAHYVHEARQAQPHGPYRLVGHSLGGVIAYEMAQQFAAQGQSVEFLGLLDAYGPATLRQMRRLPLHEQASNALRLPPALLSRYAYAGLLSRLDRIPPLRRLIFG